MFTNYEKKLLGDDYFTIIREEVYRIEVEEYGALLADIQADL